jgi:EAL domain-containing protein (putative c-di-GMP-specific phosphodiesterase class I)
MASTAEIAETKQQQELLRAPGCAEMQSDLFSEADCGEATALQPVIFSPLTFL